MRFNGLSKTPFECDLCQRSGTTPDFRTFEYLSLARRFQAWYEDPKIFRNIVDYRRIKLQDLLGAQSTDEGTAIYEDYFDGLWFHRLGFMFGGYEAIEYDVFIATSTDG